MSAPRDQGIFAKKIVRIIRDSKPKENALQPTGPHVPTKKGVLLITNDLLSGKTLAQATDIPQEELESAFQTALSLYESGSFDDALKVFRALTLLSHDDERFFMGVGACCQSLKDYPSAIDAYGLAAVASKMKDPLPLLYGAKCHILNNDRENAAGALECVLEFCEQGIPEHDRCAAEARRLLDRLSASTPAGA